MNDILIKKFIRYKLNIAQGIVDLMPVNLSKEIKNIGRMVIEEINVASKEGEKLKDHKIINQVPIE